MQITVAECQHIHKSLQLYLMIFIVCLFQRLKQVVCSEEPIGIALALTLFLAL